MTGVNEVASSNWLFRGWLLVDGCTLNEEIASELVLTNGTVANHVAGILGRLGLSSRAQIAAWATAHGLNGTLDRLLVTLERLLEFSRPGSSQLWIGRRP